MTQWYISERMMCFCTNEKNSVTLKQLQIWRSQKSITLKYCCFLVKYWLLTSALHHMEKAKFAPLCLNTQ